QPRLRRFARSLRAISSLAPSARWRRISIGGGFAANRGGGRKGQTPAGGGVWGGGAPPPPPNPPLFAQGGVPGGGEGAGERRVTGVQGCALPISAEAAAVRTIFARYLELGSVRALAQDLDRRGIRSKPRRLSNGRTIGGGRFGVGALAHLLKNRFYIGEVVYR